MDSEDKSTHKLVYTVHKLKKLEDIFEDFGYKVRYEKGNFQGGYCLVLDKKVVVLNKFSDTESRINILLEIAESPKRLSFYNHNYSFHPQQIHHDFKRINPFPYFNSWFQCGMF